MMRSVRHRLYLEFTYIGHVDTSVRDDPIVRNLARRREHGDLNCCLTGASLSDSSARSVPGAGFGFVTTTEDILRAGVFFRARPGALLAPPRTPPLALSALRGPFGHASDPP